MQAPGSEWLPYIQDAAWLPHAYDWRSDTLVFANLPKEAQRRAVFLDSRFVAEAPLSAPAPVEELSIGAIREVSGQVHFLFHTAFCCSTLLARALDIPGVSMGLKEPGVLSSFAEYWSGSRRTPGAFLALGAALDLLSRPLEPGETQIVKPSNVVNHIVPQMLHARPDSKAIILYSSLDTFLRAIARRGMEGRAFARQVFQQFAPVIPIENGFTEADMVLQTDMQIAAQAWLMQTAFLDSVARRFGRSIVRTLSSERFLADTAGTLNAVSGFFNLSLDKQRAAEIAAGPVFSEHAKELGRPFDAAALEAQHKQAGAMYADEIASAKNWARNLAMRYDTPLSFRTHLSRDLVSTHARAVIVDVRCKDQFIGARTRDERFDAVLHRFRRADRGAVQHLLQRCALSLGQRRFERRIGRLQLAGNATTQARERLHQRGRQHAALFIALGREQIEAEHHIRLLQLLRRLKSSAIDLNRAHHLRRREVRCEGERQTKRRRELSAERGRTQNPERHVRAFTRHRAHDLTGLRRRQQRLQFQHVLRKPILTADQRAPQRHRNALIAARRAPEPEINAARIKCFECSKLLRDHDRCVVRQHDPAGADADGLRRFRRIHDCQRRRGAGDAWHIVMLSEPKAVVPQPLRIHRQIARIVQSLRNVSALNNGREIKN